MLKKIFVLAALVAFMGCAKLPSPTATSIEQAGVQGAAVYVGTTFPNTVPVILGVSNYVISAANGKQVITAAEVNAEVLKEEAALPKLTVAEKGGINTFLVTLQPLIAQELASAHINTNANITIELCWVAQWASQILGNTATCNVQPQLVSAPTTT